MARERQRRPLVLASETELRSLLLAARRRREGRHDRALALLVRKLAPPALEFVRTPDPSSARSGNTSSESTSRSARQSPIWNSPGDLLDLADCSWVLLAERSLATDVEA